MYLLTYKFWSTNVIGKSWCHWKLLNTMDILHIASKISGLLLWQLSVICIHVITSLTYVIGFLLKVNTNHLVLDDIWWSILVVIEHPKVFIGCSLGNG